MQLSLDTSNVQHEKIVFQLVTPYIEGFSVPLESEDSMEVDKPTDTSTTQKETPNKSFTDDDDKGGKKKRKRAK